ncbi:MAG: Azurin [Verrucomicrobiaceae bacterium]|nr:MAG: Azurin [Verrucomicrobiaceae bacterium]
MKNLSLIFAALIAAPCAFADTKLELTGNDQMQFNAKTLEATAGEKVTLSFKHIGTLPVIAMGHNVVILKPGTSVPSFAAKCASAKDTGYLPQDPESKAAVVAATKLLGGGQSDSVEFTPTEPGAYPYICTFPGHFAIMQGVLTVKAK